MTMLELRRIWHTCMLLGMIALGTASCDSAIYDDEGDCAVHSVTRKTCCAEMLSVRK